MQVLPLGSHLGNAPETVISGQQDQVHRSKWVVREWELDSQWSPWHRVTSQVLLGIKLTRCADSFHIVGPVQRVHQSLLASEPALMLLSIFFPRLSQQMLYNNKSESRPSVTKSMHSDECKAQTYNFYHFFTSSRDETYSRSLQDQECIYELDLKRKITFNGI